MAINCILIKTTGQVPKFLTRLRHARELLLAIANQNTQCTNHSSNAVAHDSENRINMRVDLEDLC